MTNDPFLRISVLGTVRNADLVLPADQSLAALLPQILGLLGESQGPQGAYMLTTALGEPVDLEHPMGGLGLEDGSVLRLSVATDTPPVPVVSDLVDVTAEHDPAGKWAGAARGWALGFCSALVMLAALVLLLQGRGSDVTDVGATAAGLYAISMCLRFIRQDLAWAYLTVAGIVGLWGVWLRLAAGWPPLLVLFIWLAVQLLALIVHTRQRFAYSLGLGILAIGAGLWCLVHYFVADQVRAGAVVSTLALLLLGLTPRLALTLAGIFKADADVGNGTSLALSEVVGRLDRAHQVLSVAVGLVSLLWLLGMLPLAGAAIGSTWTLGMTAALVVAWTLRGRHFPLAAERTAIYVAAIAGLGTVAWSQRATVWAVIGLVVLALALAGMLFINVSDLAAAQLRRISTWLETLAVVATIPVLVGMFDLYTQLLGSFK